MKLTYETTAISTGGRSGKVVVENSPLEFEMTSPAELGSKKSGVNPEQLFAAGYSACFGSALQHVIRTKKLHIPTPSVQITVGLGKEDDGSNILSAKIVATLSGVDQDTADVLVNEAHFVCPYSNATRGNIEVAVSAKVIVAE